MPQEQTDRSVRQIVTDARYKNLSASDLLSAAALSRVMVPPPEQRLRKPDGSGIAWSGHTHAAPASGMKMRGLIAKEGKTDLSLYEFQFNPPEMKGKSAAQWETYNSPGTFLPIASFMHMDTPSTSLEIFIDATDPSVLNTQREIEGEFMGVWVDILALLGFVNPDIRKETYDTIYQPSTGRFVSPSPVIIVMGPIVLRTILKSVSWSILHWRSDLIPLRAEVTLEFDEITSSLKNDFNRMQAQQLGSASRLSDATRGQLTQLSQAVGVYGAESFFSPEG